MLAAQSPSDCFPTAIEAVRIAVKYRTPVIVLSDGDCAAITGTGDSPLRPNITCSRSACSVLVGIPVLGPARWTSITISGIAGNQAASFLTAVFVAPPVEETSKGLALLIAFLVAYAVARRRGIVEFSGVMDGIVYFSTCGRCGVGGGDDGGGCRRR